MSVTADAGVPYPSAKAGRVDAWSKRVYRTLQNWAVASQGKWTRWEPGYLLLTITRVEGREIEPIQLYTADEEITVEFGYWITHNPGPPEPWNAEPEVVADYAKATIERWLKGDLRTAVLSDADGKWCGSLSIEPGDLIAQLKEAAQWLRDYRPARIEVRAPFKSDWQYFDVDPEWLRPAPLSPDRLPK